MRFRGDYFGYSSHPRNSTFQLKANQMQIKSLRSQARAIHDDTQSAMIRVHPSWAIGAHALKAGPVRTYRKPSHARIIARTLGETFAAVVAGPAVIGFGFAMVSPTGSKGAILAGDVFALYANAWAFLQTVL